MPIVYGHTGSNLVSVSRASNGSVRQTSFENYVRDGLGNIQTLTETIQGVTRVRVFGYDGEGRLETVHDGSNNLVRSYAYDANGNRTQVVSGASIVTSHCADGRASNDLDQLCQYGDDAYMYDGRGALREKQSAAGNTRYEYDGAGKLNKVVLPNGDTIHYVHDALGRRVGKVKNGQLVKGWLYADGLRPIAQLNSAGQLEATFVYATRSNVPDYVVQKAGSTQVTYRVIADHLGTPRALVNVANGQVVYRLDVDEFGKVESASGMLDLLPHGFAGGMWDRETGLVRYGARDYDAVTGRWTARDPILFGGGDSNLYAYVGNDPVNLIDPTGTDAWSALGSFAEGAAGAVVGGVVVSAALASGTVVGGVAAAAIIGYGAYSGAMALNEVINGATSDARIDAAAGLLGGALGGAWSSGKWWSSRELEFGPDLRLAPFGNRGVGHPPHPIGKYPHYHRRGTDASGKTRPGQSLKRHRPLETKGTDTGFCDRF